MKHFSIWLVYNEIQRKSFVCMQIAVLISIATTNLYLYIMATEVCRIPKNTYAYSS